MNDEKADQIIELLIELHEELLRLRFPMRFRSRLHPGPAGAMRPETDGVGHSPRATLPGHGVFLSEARRDWFQALACHSHVWPVCGCDNCWSKIQTKLNSMGARDCLPT